MKIQKLHCWGLSPKEAILLQQRLATSVVISALDRPIRTVAGTDISYSKREKRLFAAVVVMDLESLEILERASHIEEATFPYVPGLLAFREIPPLLKAFQKLQQVPDLILCDGQGIAHPRGIGLASHLGLWLQIPAIGCAKSRLIGESSPLPVEKGGESILVYKGQKVGIVLRSKKNTNPLWISPGHLIDSEGSLLLVKKCLRGYRLPEPTRQAHLAVNLLRLHH
jgi:deoxyribonuclease V